MSDNLEKGCHWTFMQWDGVTYYGPNDAITQSFNKNFYHSLVRESIQNSLDAKKDKSEPVKVTFAFEKLNNVNYPELFNLRTHIQACLDSHKEIQRAIDLYEPMLELLPQTTNTEIDIITVSDNGDGMKYDPNDPKNTFSAFTRSVGLSVNKTKGSGGSFGFGKAAYFQMSPFRSILVSTMTRDGNETFFEGVSRLCTHKLNGVEYSNVGYYNSTGRPSSGDDIPDQFRRREPGTSITLIGKLADSVSNAEMQEELVINTLRHFWLAIYEKKLEVTIGLVTIKSEDVERLLNKYFKSTEKDSPINLFKAYTHEDSKHIFKQAETLGQLQLHVHFDPSIKKDRVSFMREPLMLVKSENLATHMGISALFLCLDETGNSILANLEDASHTSWTTSDKSGKTLKEAKLALAEIREFISSSIDELVGNKGETEIIDIGIGFSQKNVESLTKSRSEHDSPFGTVPTGQQTDEGGSLNTQASDEKNSETKYNKGNVGKEAQGDPDGNGGSQDTGRGHSKKKSKKKGGKGTSGTTKKTGTPDIEDKGLKFSLYSPTTYRTPAYQKNGEWFHDIILHIEEDIDNAFIEIKVGTEDGADSVGIAHTDKGKIGEGKGIITFGHLDKGKQKFTIQFTDKQRHTIKLK